MIQSVVIKDPNKYQLEYDIIRDHMHIDDTLKIISDNGKSYLKNYLRELKKNTTADYFECKIWEQHHETEKYTRFFNQYVKDESISNSKQFRNNLGKYCPIFHGAVNSTTQLLNSWKREFHHCDCDMLYRTLYNIGLTVRNYDLLFTEEKIKEMKVWEDNKLIDMDDDDNRCYLTGVIGYGVMSTIAYNLKPRLFPGNFKQGVFSLYFLSGREPLDMPTETSEFIMVKDMETSKTGIIESDHNYFFPYEVYAYYSLKIYNWLRYSIYKNLQYLFPSENRYVLTNDFYSFIIKCNFDKMQTLLGNDDYLKFETWSLF